MIPYEQLAAALERRAAGTPAAPAAQAAPAPVPTPPPLEDNTLSGAEDPSTEYEIGDVLADDEAG